MVGDSGKPSGVTIRNSLFSGGNSDGVRADANGVKIVGNEFRDMRDEGPFHTDPIQIYGGKRVVIRGNYFHDNEVSAAIMMADGGERNLVEHNVVAAGGLTWAMTWLSDDRSVIRHNTFADGACDFNIRCGVINIGAKASDPPGRGTIIRDNVLGGISNGGSEFAADHNLSPVVIPGVRNMRGLPTYVAPRSRYDDHRLARDSLGVGAASDGSDVGIPRDGWKAADSRPRAQQLTRRRVRTRRNAVSCAPARVAHRYSPRSDAIERGRRRDVQRRAACNGEVRWGPRTPADPSNGRLLMTRCFVVSVVVLASLAGPIASAVARDRDRDGLPDRWERRFDLSTKHRSGKGDPDRDRLSNRREYKLRLNPRRRDTDRDGLRDRAELRRWKTNPRRADTDRDGYNDLVEIRAGTNPRDPKSHPVAAGGGGPTPSAGARPRRPPPRRPTASRLPRRPASRPVGRRARRGQVSCG